MIAPLWRFPKSGGYPKSSSRNGWSWLSNLKQPWWRLGIPLWEPPLDGFLVVYIENTICPKMAILGKHDKEVYFKHFQIWGFFFTKESRSIVDRSINEYPNTLEPIWDIIILIILIIMIILIILIMIIVIIAIVMKISLWSFLYILIILIMIIVIIVIVMKILLCIYGICFEYPLVN